MTNKIKFNFLSLILIFSMSAAAETLLPKTEQTTNANLKITSAPTADTDRETLRVLNSLLKQSNWFPDLRLNVMDGMVTVEGHAADKKQLDWLITTADRLPGVITVINKTDLPATDLTDLSPATSEVRKIIDGAKRALPSILMALFLIVVFYFISRYIQRVLHIAWNKKISNPFLLSTVSKLCLLPVWLLFFYVILKTAGLSGLATTIIGGTGMLGLVLGLAFRGIAENYLAGLLLAMRSPFTKGDLIEIGQNVGYVQNLSMRGTTIINLDGNLILIPNSTVIQSVVQNRSANPLTRTEFTVGISYSDSISKAQEIIMKSLSEVRGVLSDPEINVIADSLGASSVNLKVMFWFNIEDSNQARVRSRAIIHIKESLLSNGITIPDEAREIVFADTLKVQMLDSQEAAKSHEKDRKDQIREKAVVNLEEKRNTPEITEATQQKDLMRLADASTLLTERPQGNLLKP